MLLKQVSSHQLRCHCITQLVPCSMCVARLRSGISIRSALDQPAQSIGALAVAFTKEQDAPWMRETEY